MTLYGGAPLQLSTHTPSDDGLPGSPSALTPRLLPTQHHCVNNLHTMLIQQGRNFWADLQALTRQHRRNPDACNHLIDHNLIKVSKVIVGQVVDVAPQGPEYS